MAKQLKQNKAIKARTTTKKATKPATRAAPSRRRPEPVGEAATHGVLDGASGSLIRAALQKRLRG